jgi:hypothetical protein
MKHTGGAGAPDRIQDHRGNRKGTPESPFFEPCNFGSGKARHPAGRYGAGFRASGRIGVVATT